MRPLKIIQILPALNAGGVERGTVEFARELVKKGHTSIVISNGGQLAKQLEAEGSQHIELPVHRKSLRSLLWVGKLRKTIEELAPDIVHVRSRIPAWMTYLALRKSPKAQRPGVVSTFHGLYSINAYSAIMGKADRVIAISDCVQDYITNNYAVDPAIITRIFRGLDPSAFNANACTQEWLNSFYEQYPHLNGKSVILMPGRLTRWKGQEAFIQMMSHLIKQSPDCHGVIVGEAESNKQHYLDELKDLQKQLNLQEHLTFTGHRSDIHALYGLAKVTCHMSNKPEPFGR
ncbi:MAG: glycosyltransferase, partial [Pseudomonadales bacterium]|nr:glycosyltransferase [Pseudomonadales bacterium]